MGNKGEASLHSFLHQRNKHQSLGFGHEENDRRSRRNLSKDDKDSCISNVKSVMKIHMKATHLLWIRKNSLLFIGQKMISFFKIITGSPKHCNALLIILKVSISICSLQASKSFSFIPLPCFEYHFASLVQVQIHLRIAFHETATSLPFLQASSCP